MAPLHEELVAAGYHGWFDAFIMPGEDWKARLRAEIARCDAFIFVASPVSVVSDWCRWELATSIELRRPIVPALLVAGTELPPELRDIQHADLSEGVTPASVARLLGGLSMIRLDRTPEPSHSGILTGVPVQVVWRNSRRSLHVSGSAVLDEADVGGLANPSRAYSRRTPRSGRAVGIDFGTIASMVAIADDGRPVPIPNASGGYATPSAVGVSTDGEVVVGEAARALAKVHPERAVLYPKRLLGTGKSLFVDGEPFSPSELVSFVMKELVEQAKHYLDGPVRGAVMTAPAYFSQAEAADLRLATHLADIEPLRLVAEPTAAALAAGFDESDRTIAVYDLGGGTFDISILEVGEGLYDVKWVGGDMQLGGADYDRLVRDYCVSRFMAETGVDLSADPIALVRVQEAAEAAKIMLSTAERAMVYVPFVYGDGVRALNLNVPLTRSKYEDITFHLTDETLDLCRVALENSPNQIDELVLVGLTTRTPSLRAQVEGLFGLRARRDVDPDRSVALGAAIQAGVLEGKVKDVLLLDVVSRGIGVATSGDGYTEIVSRFTNIPTTISRFFYPESPDQRMAVIEFKEVDASGGTLAWVVVEVPHPRYGDVPIDVTVDIDANMTTVFTAGVLGSTDFESVTIPSVERLPPTTTAAGAAIVAAVESKRLLRFEVADAEEVRRVVDELPDVVRWVKVTVTGGYDGPLVEITAPGRSVAVSEEKAAKALEAVQSEFAVRGIASRVN